jgi:hypothetical protein
MQELIHDNATFEDAEGKVAERSKIRGSPERIRRLRAKIGRERRSQRLHRCVKRR